MKKCKKHMLLFDKVCPKCNETKLNFEDNDGNKN
jgi:RNA polymerase subunit RPABC4/transcription elongation factor Spt4